MRGPGLRLNQILFNPKKIHRKPNHENNSMLGLPVSNPSYIGIFEAAAR